MSMRLASVLVYVGLIGFGLVVEAEHTPPVIDHSPIGVAVKGQNVIVRAAIRDDAGPIKESTLFVAVSRDAAPFRINMTHGGSNLYTGTISSDLIGSLNRIQYYIDAVDSEGLTTETPWYTIDVKSPEPGKTVPLDGGPPPVEQQKRPAWVKPALIAGGVLVAGGAVVALSGGGGGGGGSGSTTNSSVAGTYTGSATTCFQPPSANSTCSSGSITITVDAGGNVTSDTLYPGQSLQGRLSGMNFVLGATVQTADRTGQIDYIGTIVDNKIVGSIQGAARTTGGDGTYSGTFTAVKR